MNITEMGFQAFREKLSKDEGIIFLGAGGELKEWFQVIDVWKEEDIVPKESKFEDLFKEVILLKTSGGRRDLVFVFEDQTPFNLGKLAMWRLRWGDCSWISDYLTNYVSQHEG